MGITFTQLKREVEGKISTMTCLVSHSHGDHSKGMKDAMKGGVSVYAPEETHKSVGTLEHRRAKVLTEYEFFTVGEFDIMAFPAKHNVQTMGFLIRHPDCGTICYITDTAFLDMQFGSVNYYLIEANFCRDIVINRAMDNTINVGLGQRVLDDHLSIDDCQRMLAMQDLSQVELIVLLHLSDRNSDEVSFRKRVIQQTGKPVYIANPGLELDLCLDPFIDF